MSLSAEQSRAVDKSLAPTASGAAADQQPLRGELGGTKRGRAFLARSSRLDYDSVEHGMGYFRGFFVLFWTAVAFYVVSTVARNAVREGVFLGSLTFRLMKTNFLHFVLVDLLMVASLFVVVPINRMFLYFHATHANNGPGSIAQHSFQILFFVIWLGIAWRAEWSWIQSGVFTLHFIAMLFKIHSYSATNGDLRDAWLLQQQNTTINTNKKVNFPPPQPPPSSPSSSSSLSLLAESIQGVEILTDYPETISFARFMDYLLCPTLVYEPDYPRTKEMRIHYVLQKIAATFAVTFLIYITLEHYIMPVLHALPNHSFAYAVAELLFPFMLCYLMFFYVIFECVCNGFAELTRFADRNFYDDWWNSSTFDQFARRWNKPVHEFLLRHVYIESIRTHKVSKKAATYITFLFSSCLHELVMVMVARRVRLYLFVLQMFQLPLIYVGRCEWSRRHPIAGNIFFWFSMFCGPPMLAVGYCWEFYA